MLICMSAYQHTPHRRLTVAQARDRLADIVHEVEAHGPVELTEDGEAVAVIMTLDEYPRLADARLDSWTAYERFRLGTDFADLNVDDGVFNGLRCATET